MPYLTVRRGQPLLAVPWLEIGEAVTRYYNDEREMRRDLAASGLRSALELAGVWSDLDWEETHRALDRIRHQSAPGGNRRDAAGQCD
jgi:hypothetical protein